MPMTTDDAIAIYHTGQELVVALLLKFSAENDALKLRIQQLENQAAKDSHNSNKPPATDGFKKNKTKTLRTASSRRVGGQQGHNGQTLQQVEHPDHKIVHRVAGNCACGFSLTDIEATAYEARQVFDLPPIKIEVTEHRAEIKACPQCGKQYQAHFPDHVTKTVQYGNRVKAFSVYLMNYQFIPYERTQQFFRDIFSLPLSQGTLVNFNKYCYHRLQDTEQFIKQHITTANVAHFDESGLYVNGTRHWLHVASTSELTYYACHAKRGQLAMQDIGILPNFNGTAVHDHLKSYFTFSCKHGLCNAHHLRELKYVAEQYQQSWAQDMAKLLCEIKNNVALEKIQRNCLDDNLLKNYKQHYEIILDAAAKANPPPQQTIENRKRGRSKQTEPKNLLDRLRDYAHETLAFMDDFNVPFDNNLAERDVRMIKVQQKISGTFRSELGAKYFCRIRGYIATVKKQNLNVLDAIEAGFLNALVIS
jgi:transposase